MRLLGAAVLMLVALFATVGYRRFAYCGVAVGEAFLELLVGLRRHISVSGAPIDKYMAARSGGPLEECGFYAEYRRCGRLSLAFSRVSGRLCLSAGLLDELSDVFGRLGGSDIEGEVRLLDAAIAEIERMNKEFKGETERSVRVVSVVVVAVSLALLILLL